MALPQWLLNNQLAAVPMPLVGSSAMVRLGAAGFSPVFKLKNFVMEQQAQLQWCWAAVAKSVSTFFNAASTWTQCALADHELGQSTCCSTGASALCNQPWSLDLALTTTGNLDRWIVGTATDADVAGEMMADRPLGCRIQWSDTTGHFVVISGYQNNGTDVTVDIDDPWYGPSNYEYTAFCTAYRNDGVCTHQYFTHA